MEDIIEFLKRLTDNNDKVWFNAHKDEYVRCKRKFDDFVEEMIPAVQEIDQSIGQLSVSDCTWRIYRDTRFSKDKRPYKNYMGCYFAPEGKKGPYSGYYFEVDICDETGEPRGMIAVGNYYTEPKVLKILREDIDTDQAEALESALDQAKGFKLDDRQMLKRVPRGFHADKPYSEYFKYKNLCIFKMVDVDYITAPGLKSRLVEDFASAKPFLHFLNRAIEYSIENED